MQHVSRKTARLDEKRPGGKRSTFVDEKTKGYRAFFTTGSHVLQPASVRLTWLPRRKIAADKDPLTLVL